MIIRIWENGQMFDNENVLLNKKNFCGKIIILKPFLNLPLISPLQVT